MTVKERVAGILIGHGHTAHVGAGIAAADDLGRQAAAVSRQLPEMGSFTWAGQGRPRLSAGPVPRARRDQVSAVTTAMTATRAMSI